MDIYQTLQELGHELPPPPPSGGIYKSVRQAGTMLYISGQGPVRNGKPVYTGKVGAGRSLEEGREAAVLCTLNALGALHHYLGNLNRVRGLVKTLGFVASAPGFNQQPKVIDGASSLLRELWGEDGVGARSAVSAPELPADFTVEIEFIFELKE